MMILIIICCLIIMAVVVHKRWQIKDTGIVTDNGIDVKGNQKQFIADMYNKYKKAGKRP